MSNRIVKAPIYQRYFKIDLDEIETYVVRRYQEIFGEPPLEVDVQKYPDEIDIVIYTPELNAEKSDFRRMVKRELNDEGLSVLVVMESRPVPKS